MSNTRRNERKAWRSILKRLARENGRANLRRADLRDADLRDADLRDADLWGANLRGADLRDADLRDADLRDADLWGANLRGANLRRANLQDANLRGANLRRANLRRADLRDAGLRDADLSQALGLFSASDYISENFEFDEQGNMIVYKQFGLHRDPVSDWKIEPGSVITENVNPIVTQDCGCGVNVAKRDWSGFDNRPLWKCIIRKDWFFDVVVPWGTDGKVRAAKVELVEVLKRAASPRNQQARKVCHRLNLQSLRR